MIDCMCLNDLPPSMAVMTLKPKRLPRVDENEITLVRRNYNERTNFKCEDGNWCCIYIFEVCSLQGSKELEEY